MRAHYTHTKCADSAAVAERCRWRVCFLRLFAYFVGNRARHAPCLQTKGIPVHIPATLNCEKQPLFWGWNAKQLCLRTAYLGAGVRPHSLLPFIYWRFVYVCSVSIHSARDRADHASVDVWICSAAAEIISTHKMYYARVLINIKFLEAFVVFQLIHVFQRLFVLNIVN
jgi:hypothetical protein